MTPSIRNAIAALSLATMTLTGVAATPAFARPGQNWQDRQERREDRRDDRQDRREDRRDDRRDQRADRRDDRRDDRRTQYRRPGKVV